MLKIIFCNKHLHETVKKIYKERGIRTQQDIQYYINMGPKLNIKGINTVLNGVTKEDIYKCHRGKSRYRKTFPRDPNTILWLPLQVIFTTFMLV